MKKHFFSSLNKSDFRYFCLLIILLTLLIVIPSRYALINKSKSEPIIIPENIPFDHLESSEPFLMFVEYPVFDRTLTKPDPDLPQEVNEYLSKTTKYTQLLLDKLPESVKIDAVLLIESNGEERILVFGGKKTSEEYHFTPETLYLFDSSLTLLEERELGAYSSMYNEYFVSAKFRDRIWVQTICYSATNGEKHIKMIQLQNDKLHIDKKYGGDAEYTGFKTYKIINSDTNPRMVLHKNNRFYWDYVFYVLWVWLSIYDFCFEHRLIFGVIGIFVLLISFVLLWFEKKHLNQKK